MSGFVLCSCGQGKEGSAVSACLVAECDGSTDTGKGIDSCGYVGNCWGVLAGNDAAIVKGIKRVRDTSDGNGVGDEALCWYGSVGAGRFEADYCV